MHAADHKGDSSCRVPCPADGVRIGDPIAAGRVRAVLTRLIGDGTITARSNRAWAASCSSMTGNCLVSHEPSGSSGPTSAGRSRRSSQRMTTIIGLCCGRVQRPITSPSITSLISDLA